MPISYLYRSIVVNVTVTHIDNRQRKKKVARSCKKVKVQKRIKVLIEIL